MKIYIVKMVHVYAELCRIKTDKNFGITSIGAQCVILNRDDDQIKFFKSINRRPMLIN